MGARGPKAERTETVWVRLRPETKAWLEREAKALNFSVSRIAEGILDEARKESEFREGKAPHPLLRED